MFWRLFGTYGVLMLGAIGLLGAVLVSRVEKHYAHQIDERLKRNALFIADLVRDWPPGQAELLENKVRAWGQENGTRITLLDRSGRVLADSVENPQAMENHLDRPEIQEARAAGIGMAARFSDTVKQSMQYVALRTDDASPLIGYVRVALPMDEIHQEVLWLHRVVWTAAAITSLAAMVLAFWLSRRFTQPVQQLTEGAARIAAGDYGQKVYLTGHDEVGTLARTFNYMSTRLAEQFTQLEEDRQQLRTILSSMVEGVVALDAGQAILFANERAAQLLGFQAQQVVGRKFWEVVRRRTLQDIVRKALQGPEPCSDEVKWDGSAVKSLTIHAARLPGDPVRGAVLVIYDTTELRRLERLRQDFVANVSHELKTPLSVIKACIETLLDGAVDDSENRGAFLEQISGQADRLHALILDLLSLGRIESGAELFEFQVLPLEPLVMHCLEPHRARAEAKRQVLEAIPVYSKVSGGVVSGEWSETGRASASSEAIPNDRPGNAADHSPLTTHHSPVSDHSPLTHHSPVSVWADEEAVSQILENLVDNALKYTPPGGHIRVRWWAENGTAHLEVEDTGIGIPEQDLPRVFERFYRVDKARSREMGGTGLGLSIVKHLVQAMQGSVEARSQLGKGTTFHVQLRTSQGG
jgi:two-component system, OmpR family, phosphate regulon sensor histidine kinase PhoR